MTFCYKYWSVLYKTLYINLFLRFDSNIIFFFGTKTVLGLYCEEENIDTGLGTFVSFCQNQSRLDATSTGRADDRGAVGKYLVIDQAP